MIAAEREELNRELEADPQRREVLAGLRSGRLRSVFVEVRELLEQFNNAFRDGEISPLEDLEARYLRRRRALYGAVRASSGYDLDPSEFPDLDWHQEFSDSDSDSDYEPQYFTMRVEDDPLDFFAVLPLWDGLQADEDAEENLALLREITSLPL